MESRRGRAVRRIERGRMILKRIGPLSACSVCRWNWHKTSTAVRTQLARGLCRFPKRRSGLSAICLIVHETKTPRMAENEPELLWTIHFGPEKRKFGISDGLG